MPISVQDFYNLNPTPVMKGIVQVITNTSIFLKRLKFLPPINGFIYKYNQETALGGIAFRNLNNYYKPIGKDDSVINPEFETLGLFGGIVTTDRQLVNASGGGGFDVRASKINAKVHKASLFFDRNCIKGDPAVTSGAYTGLNARLTGNNLQLTGVNGGAMTIDMVVKLQDQVVGSNEKKVLVMNKGTRRSLSSLVRADARGMQFREASGTQLANFNGSDIEELHEDGDETPILALNETCGNNPTTTSMYCVNFGQDFDEQNVQGLVSNRLIEHVAYGERSGIYEDLVEGNMGLAVFHPGAAARLAGITYTT